jgi:hypothetical protein
MPALQALYLDYIQLDGTIPLSFASGTKPSTHAVVVAVPAHILQMCCDPHLPLATE